MYNVLYELQHFNEVTDFASVQDYRRYKFSKKRKVNLKLAKNYNRYKYNTNIHITDFRPIENYYQNIWIKGLIKGNIFILQDYGNDRYYDSKFKDRVFLNDFRPSIGLNKFHLYLISKNAEIILIGPHYLKPKQFEFFTNNFNDKRPFEIWFEKKVYMNIRLRWRNGIVSGDYEFQYYIGMDK